MGKAAHGGGEEDAHGGGQRTARAAMAEAETDGIKILFFFERRLRDRWVGWGGRTKTK